ncbi:MAG: SDR family oxidoreductase [Archangium sp.]|nr:SDR family oxidoreductase [Archangium sp.]
MKIAILGASGRTGRLLVRQALDAGHDVRALVRSPGTFLLRHDKLEVVEGEVGNAQAVAALVSGCDAVASALGPSPGHVTSCSEGTKHVIAAGAKRYVAVSGAGLDVPGDKKDLIGKVVSFFVRTLSPAVFQDKVNELKMLQDSSLPWVLVRPPRLVDAPATGAYRVSLERSPGASISRADLASFVLKCLTSTEFNRQAPFIAG